MSFVCEQLILLLRYCNKLFPGREKLKATFCYFPRMWRGFENSSEMRWDGTYCGYWCRHRSKDCSMARRLPSQALCFGISRVIPEKSLEFPVGAWHLMSKKTYCNAKYNALDFLLPIQGPKIWSHNSRSKGLKPQRFEAIWVVLNKLAKALKTRKSPGTLGLKKLELGKLWVKKVWVQNIFYKFSRWIG